MGMVFCRAEVEAMSWDRIWCGCGRMMGLAGEGCILRPLLFGDLNQGRKVSKPVRA